MARKNTEFAAAPTGQFPPLGRPQKAIARAVKYSATGLQYRSIIST